MRILWIAGNPAMYNQKSAYNGGGWIAALQEALMTSKDLSIDIDLAIGFLCDRNFKDSQQGCCYYGIKRMQRPTFFYSKKERIILNRLSEIIKDFHPEVIHVFGTEEVYGLVTTITSIPVIIHIQGLLSAVKEAWLPQNMSWGDVFKSNPKKFLEYRNLKRFIVREHNILQSCKYFMGRTEWDQSISQFLADDARYFYCGEMLRPVIYNSEKQWKKGARNKKIIVSIISTPLYKGGDVVLRTAALLKQYGHIDFEWIVYGIQGQQFIERKLKVLSQSVNVKYGGVIDAQHLVDALTNADVFVHPSYIENSPNTVCEAQILGLPVIATNVGGTCSIINHGHDGILVPANDIYMMASQITRVLTDSDYAIELGTNGRKIALQRHSPRKIVSDLITIYSTIANKKCN